MSLLWGEDNVSVWDDVIIWIFCKVSLKGEVWHYNLRIEGVPQEKDPCLQGGRDYVVLARI